jgi:chromosome segregation ATPase
LLEKQNKKVNELLADLERVSDDRKDRDRQIDQLKDDLRLKETELQRTTSELHSKLEAMEEEMVKKSGDIEKGNETIERSRKALQDLTDSVQNKDREVMLVIR